MFQQFKFSTLILAMLVFMPTALIAADDVKSMSWEQLVELRANSFKQLRKIIEEVQSVAQELQKNARSNEPDAAVEKDLLAQRQKLIEEYTAIATRMQKEIFPELQSKVIPQLEKNPQDEQTKEVAEELMQFHYARNNYPALLQVSSAVVKVDPQNDTAVNFAGVANFAEHNFENSNRILTLAEKNNQLLGDLGKQYLDISKTYIDYWKKEKAIREKEAAATGNDQLPRVKLETTKGDIVLELFENEAPNTVANFINLVEKGFYDGLKFHRVIPNFMAQGGCPFSKTDPQRAGSGGPGYSIDCEAYRPDARRHFSGSLSMAHAGKNTGGSQFFITHLPTAHLDREIAPQSVHTVFGRVAEGLDVARSLEKEDVIKSAKVTRKRDHDYVPETGPER